MLVMIVQNSLGRDLVDDIVVFACDGKLSVDVDVILAACVVAVVSFVLTMAGFVVVAWVYSVAGESCAVLSLVGVVDVRSLSYGFSLF